MQIIKLLLILIVSFASLQSFAVDLAPLVRQRYFDANGVPLAGGKLFSYDAGTTTPRATFTDQTGSTANPNPIILDANGEANVWIGSGFFKFVLKDVNDVVQWTVDKVSIPSEAALASAFWRDVIYISFTDSPFTLTSAHNGKLISVATAGGAVVINLPQMSTIVLPYNIGVQLYSGSNTVSIARTGTDTINGSSSSKVLSAVSAGAQFIADTDKSPDDWSVIDIGTVADNSITKAKLTNTTLYQDVVSTTTTPYTVAAADDVILMDATAGAKTINLPAAASHSGRVLDIKKIDSSVNTVTVDANASETIDGALTAMLDIQNSVLNIISDGTNWRLMGQRGNIESSAASRRIEDASLSNNGVSASIDNQSGNWIASVSRTAAGIILLTYTTGKFSATPNCSCSARGTNVQCWIDNPGPTSLSVRTSTDTTSVDSGLHILCAGPK